MKDESENKIWRPEFNKADKAAENKMLRIKIRSGRSVEGVTVDAEGYALVDAKTADHLFKIGYAIKED